LKWAGDGTPGKLERARESTVDYLICQRQSVALLALEKSVVA
jgi:hypothetical protein